MKRLMTLILVVLMVTGLYAVATAESATTWDSKYFSSYGVSLSATGSGKINITMSCTSVGTASQLGVSTYSIYRYDDGTWTLVSGPHNGSYGYGVSSFGMAKTFSGVKGEKYKVTCTFLCTKGGTTETKNYTSRTVTAK